MTEAVTMDINEIMEYLPHRHPFLLVDRIVECVPGETLRAIKNVTVNEPFFPGHFPHRPVMPGVMMLEALAQASGLLAFLTERIKPGPDTALYFVGIDKARFRRPVVPGDRLTLDTRLERNRRGIWCFDTIATVDGETAVSAKVMVALRADPE